MKLREAAGSDLSRPYPLEAKETATWRSPLLVLIAILLFATPAFADTSEPQRIVNDAHHFAYTCEAGSVITYKKGGNGFTCFHKPQPGVKGDALYGLLVFASPDYSMSPEGAKAAGLDSTKAGAAGPITTQGRLDELAAADMQAQGHAQGGTAHVSLPGKKSLAVPYYTWKSGAHGMTRYALTYVVLHGTDFINVQVESEAPFSQRQIDWLAGELELLELGNKPATATGKQ